MDKKQLELLQQQLPPLQFDTHSDIDFSGTALANEYLNFYGINFAADFPSVQHGFGRLDSGGFTLAAHYWLNPVLYSAAGESPSDNGPGTLFLVHGYFDHVALYGPFIRAALARGFSVVAFDLPGHGLSSGEPAVIDSFSEYTDALSGVIEKHAALMPKPWSIVGQSTGGAVALDYLWRVREQKLPYPFHKTLLLAPLVRARGWKELGWLFPVLKLCVKNFKRGFAPSSHDADFIKFITDNDPLQARVLPLAWVGAMKNWIARVQAQAISEQEILLIQGDADNTVDWKYNTKILTEKFPNLHLGMLENARHHLLRESPEYRQQVLDAALQYLRH